MKYLLICSLLVSALQAQEVKHIMTAVSGGLPEAADFSIKPMGYEYGVKLSFLITGNNLIMVDEDSLKTEESGWKLGAFTRVNPDGTLATFSVTKKGEYVGKEGEVRVKGSLTIVTGQNTKTETFTLNKKAAPVVVNDMKVSLGEKNVFGGQGVKVNGDFSCIKSIVVKQDGKELDDSGTSWSGQKKTYQFSGIEDGAEVSLTYWTDIEEKTIEFEKQ